jgi:hypothetical protein
MTLGIVRRYKVDVKIFKLGFFNVIKNRNPISSNLKTKTIKPICRADPTRDGFCSKKKEERIAIIFYTWLRIEL